MTNTKKYSKSLFLMIFPRKKLPIPFLRLFRELTSKRLEHFASNGLYRFIALILVVPSISCQILGNYGLYIEIDAVSSSK